MFGDDSESRRFELNIRLQFLKPILAQHLPQNFVFFGVPQTFGTFRLNNHAHSKHVQKTNGG